MITKNMSIFVLASAVLSATALISSPGRIAYAQGNATSTIDTDIWVEALKAKHPALATIPDIADIAEDKDVIGKLKSLDAKEAVNTLIALNIVRDLMQYKQAQEVQRKSIFEALNEHRDKKNWTHKLFLSKLPILV